MPSKDVDVKWNTEIAAGDGSINRNTHAGGFGTRIKRGAQLICDQDGAGPDGGAVGANKVDLGILGNTAYPGTTASKNDIPAGGGGNEDTAQLAAIHCK